MIFRITAACAVVAKDNATARDNDSTSSAESLLWRAHSAKEIESHSKAFSAVHGAFKGTVTANASTFFSREPGPDPENLTDKPFFVDDFSIRMLVGTNVCAQSRKLVKEFVNPTAMGFTTTVATTSGDTKIIYVSGQVGFGDTGVPVGASEQADIAFEHLISELKDAGATIHDEVKLNVYIKEMNADDMGKVSAAKDKHFTQENQPAATWVGVTSHAFPPLKVEVEAIAVVGAR
ncbi:MAG: RidA family protein [Candidatus Hydrogenedentota bacterium]